MKWFFQKKHTPPLVVEPPKASRVEVELHKGASVIAAQKADQANKHLTDLLVENGFTLKIYIAAGGKNSKKDGNKK